MQTQYNHILKIYNPIVSSVRTYRSKSPIVKIGSSEECDLQIYLPSLLPVHIVVNFEEGRITAMGNDVHCDTVSIIQGTSLQFGNDSIIRIHNIFMMFLSLEDIGNTDKYDDRILMESTRFKEYSPILKIAHKDSTMSSDTANISSKEDGDRLDMPFDNQINNTMRELRDSNSILLGDSYKKELGDFCDMPHITPLDMIDDNTVIKKVIEEAEEEFRNDYNTEPSPKMLEAAIHRKMEDIHNEFNEILEDDPNIHINKPHRQDLGVIAIENEILKQAEAVMDSYADGNKVDDIGNRMIVDDIGNRMIVDDIGSRMMVDDIGNRMIVDDIGSRIVEAEINSLEQLKNSITDNIKEEVKSEISQIIQEEAREQVEKVIKEQLPGIMEYNNIQLKEEDTVKRIKVESNEEEPMTKAIEGPIGALAVVEEENETTHEDDNNKHMEDSKKKTKPSKKTETKKTTHEDDNNKHMEDSKKKAKPSKKTETKRDSKETAQKDKKEKPSSKAAKEKTEEPARKRPTRKAASKNKQH